MQQHDQILQQFAAILAPEQVQPWNAIDTSLQDQLSHAIALTHTPKCIVYPKTQGELAEIVGCAHRNQWTVLPCGWGSKLHWGGIAAPVDVVISMTQLNHIIEHAVGDLTVTVEAGLKFADLQAQLTPMNQWLALDPSYAEHATLGGIVATADAGFLRQRYGGARDMVIGVSVVRSDGQLVKAGGRVVKNVAGYDLMKLLTGSWGTLGIISQMTLRLYPQQPVSKTVGLGGDGSTIQTVAATLFASSLTPTAATIIAPATARALDLGRELMVLVQFQTIPVSVEQQVNQVQEWGNQQGVAAMVLEGQEEVELWQQLHRQVEQKNVKHLDPKGAEQNNSEQNNPERKTRQGGDSGFITCKVGVLPATVVATMEQLYGQYPYVNGWINVSSGLGLLQFSPPFSPDDLNQVRSHCETNGGFLSLLAAPPSWKRSLDIWGYSGNALPMMQRLKHQFDPKNCLSPGRFLV